MATDSGHALSLAIFTFNFIMKRAEKGQQTQGLNCVETE